MTEGLAIEIACAKMQELGIGKNYLLRYRHFQLQGAAVMTLKADNDLFILLTPETDTRVYSRTGIFDLKDLAVSEMQYVHSGNIRIENLNIKLPVQVKFLQVIPRLQTP